MAKRKFKLSKEQDQELKAAYHQCQDGQIKIRYQAVRLYGKVCWLLCSSAGKMRLFDVKFAGPG